MINYVLRTKEYGQGRPIYFLHGLALDMTSMIETYEPLFENQETFRRVYIDLPGMGLSPTRSEIKNSDDVLELIEAFILKNSKGEDFLLCGHSYGGYLCQGLAYKLKEKVARFFLTCPVVIANHDKRQVEKHKNIISRKPIVSNNQSFYKDYLSMNVIISEATWQMYQQRIIPGLIHFDNHFWETITAEHYPFTFETQLATSIKKQKGTILVGEFDHVTGYKDHQELYGKLLNVQVIKKSGHNLFIDQKKILVDYFNEFLENLS